MILIIILLQFLNCELFSFSSFFFFSSFFLFKDEYRDYEKNARATVREFYRENHEKQTHEYVLQMKAKYSKLDKMEMGIWEAMEFLNTLVDDSDPDTDLTQIQHNLQAAEALRKSGAPRWMILTGLIHDLGKILCFFGEPQWAVVGDTFPTGCAYSDKVFLFFSFLSL